MDSKTILYRQVHPAHVQASNVSLQAFTVTSVAFTPNQNDQGKLSVYNSEKFTPEESYVHYTNENIRVSAGVLGVSVDECLTISLTCQEDNDPFDGHSHIDFNGNSKGEIKKKASILRDNAVERGWFYLSEQSK